MPVSKKLPRISCIYAIKCIPTGKVYIGSTINYHHRLWRHFRDLRTNSHRNVYLQRSFDKYGEYSFVHGIVELCEESQLITREAFHILAFKSGKRRYGYNIKDVDEKTGRPTKIPTAKLKISAKKAIKTRIASGELISNDSVSKIRELYREGVLMKHISKILGITIKVVTSACKNETRFDEKYTYIPQKDWRFVPDEIATKVVEMYKSGSSFKEIKKKLCIGKDKINQCLKRYNIPTRKAEKHVYLNTSTGIFYNTLSEVSEIAKQCPSLLLKKMKGYVKNNTDFVIA